MTEYNPVETWRKSLSPADLDVHREALFASLRAAGKVSEKEVAGLSGGALNGYSFALANGRKGVIKSSLHYLIL